MDLDLLEDSSGYEFNKAGECGKCGGREGEREREELRGAWLGGWTGRKEQLYGHHGRCGGRDTD